MTVRRPRIGFCDFWPGHEKDNFFRDFLEEHFGAVVSNEPDYVFYSNYGDEHLKYDDRVKIFYSGENAVPDFNFCDYALGFHRLDFGDRYLRFPLYLHYRGLDGFARIERPQLPDHDQLLDRRFCNFVYSNGSNADPTRDRFFHLLSSYKPVDSGGRHLNNIGGPVVDKDAFIGAYKFTIAFENSQSPGYVTEKIIEPMLVHSLPIYWGDPTVGDDFNEASFVSARQFANLEEVVAEVARLDRDDARYLERLALPWLTRDQSTIDWAARLEAFFAGIFAQPPADAKRRPMFGYRLVDAANRRRQARVSAIVPNRVALRAYLGRVLNRWRQPS